MLIVSEELVEDSEEIELDLLWLLTLTVSEDVLEENLLDLFWIFLLVEVILVDWVSLNSLLQDFNLEMFESQDSFEDLDFIEESDDDLDILLTVWPFEELSFYIEILGISIVVGNANFITLFVIISCLIELLSLIEFNELNIYLLSTVSLLSKLLF